MARTTLDIDKPILDEIRRLHRREKKSMGRLVSDLLADALSARHKQTRKPARFHWVARPLNAKVDLDDKEAIYQILDRPDGS